MTHSCSFAGIGGADTALDLLTDASREHLTRREQRQHACSKRPALGQVTNEYAIEWLHESQQELLHRPNPPRHLFGNINQFWAPPLRSTIMELERTQPKNILEILGPAVRSGRATTKFGWCLVCKRECELAETDVHSAGTPCRDFSSQGLQEGLNGAHTIYLLCYIGLRMLLQEAVCIQENVKQFTTQVFHDFLGHIYHVDVEDHCLCEKGSLTVVEDAQDFGFVGARVRKYIIMRHKVKTIRARMPLNMFTKLFYRSCDYERVQP